MAHLSASPISHPFPIPCPTVPSSSSPHFCFALCLATSRGCQTFGQNFPPGCLTDAKCERETRSKKNYCSPCNFSADVLYTDDVYNTTMLMYCQHKTVSSLEGARICKPLNSLLFCTINMQVIWSALLLKGPIWIESTFKLAHFLLPQHLCALHCTSSESLNSCGERIF